VDDFLWSLVLMRITISSDSEVLICPEAVGHHKLGEFILLILPQLT